jgi:hypothetical protein
MMLPQKLRAIARKARAVLLPVRNLRVHLVARVRKTGRELGFEPGMIQQLEEETTNTLKESGIIQ